MNKHDCYSWNIINLHNIYLYNKLKVSQVRSLSCRKQRINLVQIRIQSGESEVEQSKKIVNTALSGGTKDGYSQDYY